MTETTIIDEITAGQGIPLAKAARSYSIHPCTIWRWAKEGLPDGRGGRVHLRMVKVGKKFFTTNSAVREFFASLPATGMEPTAPPVRTPSKRERDSARARENLKRKYKI
jgi:hypothetical protein